MLISEFRLPGCHYAMRFRLVFRNIGMWYPSYFAFAIAQSRQVSVQGLGVDKLVALTPEVSVRICRNFDLSVFLTRLQAWLAGSAACDVMITATIVFVVRVPVESASSY